MLTLGIISGWLLGLMVTGFAVLCIILVLTILIQRPQGGGLSGAFGSSAGSGQTAFGAKTGDALTLFTIGVFVLYVLAAVGLNYAVRPAVGVCCNTATGICRVVTTAGCEVGETYIAGVACSPNPCPQPPALAPATTTGGALTPIDGTPGAIPGATITPIPAPDGAPGATPITPPAGATPSSPAPSTPIPAPSNPEPATPTPANPAPSTPPAAPGSGGNP